MHGNADPVAGFGSLVRVVQLTVDQSGHPGDRELLERSSSTSRQVAPTARGGAVGGRDCGSAARSSPSGADRDAGAGSPAVGRRRVQLVASRQTTADRLRGAGRRRVSGQPTPPGTIARMRSATARSARIEQSTPYSASVSSRSRHRLVASTMAPQVAGHDGAGGAEDGMCHALPQGRYHACDNIASHSRR